MWNQFGQRCIFFNTTLIKMTLIIGLFALTASFIATNCLVIESQRPHFDGASQSCQEHTLSKLFTETQQQNQAVLPDLTKIFTSFLIFFATGVIVLAILYRKLPSDILYRRRFLFWLWAKRQPFIASKNFLLPFIAQHDA